MDEGLTARYPLEKLMIDRFKEVSNITLDQNLARLTIQLQELYADSPTKYDELTAEIRSRLGDEVALAIELINWDDTVEHERQKLKNEIDERESAKYLKNIRRLSFTLSIKHATLCVELAHKARSEGRIDQAWALTCEASHLCGEISASSLFELDTLTIEKTAKQNSKNSKGINSKTKLLKDYIALLLLENAPPDGWRTKSEAISEIVQLKPQDGGKPENVKTKIETFIIINEIKRIRASNIKNLLLKKWANEPGQIKEALTKTVRYEKPTS